MVDRRGSVLLGWLPLLNTVDDLTGWCTIVLAVDCATGTPVLMLFTVPGDTMLPVGCCPYEFWIDVLDGWFAMLLLDCDGPLM